MKNVFLFFCTIALVTMSTVLHGQQPSQRAYNPLFEQAANEFGVPADLLKGIAFAETRWDHLMWAEGDTISSCSGMPRAYGVMGLWDNAHFGHSLREAAALIGRDPADLKKDPLCNIRGAAALLRRYYDATPRTLDVASAEIESWYDAVAKFSGIPQSSIAARRAEEIYRVLAKGYHDFGITIDSRAVNLQKIKTAVAKTALVESSPVNQPDYPLAKWVASPNFGTTLISQNFVVIHDVEGSYLGCISWFLTTASQVSAHFVLNSLDDGDAPEGEVTQMVEEKYRAWHVGCWNNNMVGIEHEGYANNGAWFTPGMYAASAKLVTYLCAKYKIPIDRNHIIAHGEWQNAIWKTWMTTNYPSIDPTCNTHTDPGPYWNWPLYMSLMSRDTIPPKITDATPSTTGFDLAPAYKDIVLKFSSAMDATSTNAAVSITPSIVNMTKTWNEDSKQLTIHATPHFEFGTSYSVRIAATAKNVWGLLLDGNGDGTGGDAYQFSFTTVPLDTSGPAVVKSYPASGSVIPILPDVFIRLDEPVVASTLAGRVLLEGDSGKTVPYTSSSYATVNDRGIIAFTPVGLLPNRQYRIRLKAGLADLYGNTTKNDFIIPFSIENVLFFDGRLSDPFETNLEVWSQPRLTPGNVNIDSNATAFALASEKKRNGATSAKFSYGFTQSNGGVAVVQAALGVSVDSAATIGLWVNGDNSNNTLELVLSPGNQTIPLGILNWMGWRIIAKDIPNAASIGKKIAAVRIRQSDNGANSGYVYLDDLQLDAFVQTAVKRAEINPVTYYLSQNYPNPFNPNTAINFAIPFREFVRLTVFDALGREVANLADAFYEQGEYSVSWNAGNLSSGIYFYTLTTGKFNATKRLMLLK